MIYIGQPFCNKWVNYYCVFSCSLQSLGSLNIATRDIYNTTMSWYWQKNYLATPEQLCLFLKEFSGQCELHACPWTDYCSHQGGLFFNWLDGCISMLPMRKRSTGCPNVHELTTVSGLRRAAMEEGEWKEYEKHL